MKHFTKSILLLTTLLWAGHGIAQDVKKKVYIPNEWRNPWPSDSLLYKESDPDNKYTWSKSRSVESDNVIIFWDKNYGSKKPSESPSTYRVDEQDLLKKCEAFYDLEINKLGFVDPVTSNIAKYKIMVLLNHTTDWVCYGGGYDFQISALWLGPSAWNIVATTTRQPTIRVSIWLVATDKLSGNRQHSGSRYSLIPMRCTRRASTSSATVITTLSRMSGTAISRTGSSTISVSTTTTLPLWLRCGTRL